MGNTAWRDVSYTDKNHTDTKGRIANIQMYKVQKPKILLYGIAGAGKSSFINSIISIYQGRISSAVPAGNSSTSYSTKYRCISSGDLKNIELCDTMGLEVGSNHGIKSQDVISLIKGHIKKDYKFDPKTPIQTSSPYYNSNPQLCDKVCCVIFVVAATDIIAGLQSDVVVHLQSVLQEVQSEDINRILVITKIDMADSDVNNNITWAYYKESMKGVVQKGAKLFRLPETDVFLVKNYSGNDTQLKRDVSILLLQALERAVGFASDFVHYK